MHNIYWENLILRFTYAGMWHRWNRIVNRRYAVDYLCSKCQKKLTTFDEVYFCDTHWGLYTFCRGSEDELQEKFNKWLQIPGTE